MAGNNTFKNALAAPVSSSHKYRPLDLSTDEIRLLTLHPGSDGDEISCILSHHNLTGSIEYEALSYTWGDNASLHTIILDGLPFRVTANLKTALHHLRHTDDVRMNRVLWIDALCINQQDPKERGHQVRQMDKIFSSACKVLAWLGEARDGSDIAMDFIKRIAQGLGLFGVHGEPFTPKEIWVALHKLWDRPYWGRVWIIQELASAIEKEKPMWIPRYHAEIGCGHKWLRLDLVRNAWNNLSIYLNHPFVRGEGEYIPVCNLFTILFEHAHRRLTLSALISLTYTANATDPRDHFYAVLGLAPETDRSALIPDYTKSLKEICGQFIKHIINTEKRLDILAFDHSSCKANLPTWAPNFTSLSRSASIGWRPYWHNFQASGKSGANPPQVQFSNDLTTLTIRGFVVDTVVTVDGPFTDVESFIRDYKNNLKASLVSKKMQDYLSGVGRTL
ncbi:heterokaryon incompatibility protein-domain-containing protein, partial [Cenococcum geophilum]